MAKYKITFDREGCIGALACTKAAPAFLIESKKDGKSLLKNATFNKETGLYELIIDEKYFDINEQAANSCPVNVIKIEKIKD